MTGADLDRAIQERLVCWPGRDSMEIIRLWQGKSMAREFAMAGVWLTNMRERGSI